MKSKEKNIIAGSNEMCSTILLSERSYLSAVFSLRCSMQVGCDRRYALVSFVWPQFFPEDLTAPVSALTNTMHIILTIVTVLSWMLILGFAAAIFEKWFRYYSTGTLLTSLCLGP